MSSRPILRWFGTSGIRGRTLIDVTPNFAERMARAYAEVVVSGIDQAFVVVGRDTRFGAETIELAVISGLTAAGVSVLRCGVVPTPVLLNYQRYCKADGAIIITGSHIPPDRIGLIFIEADGAYCSDYVAYQIEQCFSSYKDSDGLLSINSVGDLLGIGWIKSAVNVMEVYMDTLEGLLDMPLIKSHPFRVIVDPGNGTAARFVTEYLSKLGLDVTAINDYPAPLSARFAEPIDENLGRLKFLVGESVDLGIAFDLDADRVTFVMPTPKGPQTIPADLMGCLMLKDMYERGYRGDVILPINTSFMATQLLTSYNITPRYCKIGQPGTIESVKKVPKPFFAYEESGKFYFLKDGLLWTDGILMALRVLELLARKKASLFDIIRTQLKDFLGYCKGTKVLNINDSKQTRVAGMLKRYLDTVTFPNEVDRITIDGVRINFKDNSWLLLRASGTEPKIRIVADAKNNERTQELIQLGEKIAQEAVNTFTA